MFHFVCLFAAAVVLAGPPGSAAQTSGGTCAVGKVESCAFATKSLPPAFQVPKRFADGYKLFQAGANLIPEAVVVKSVVRLGQPQIGITVKEADGLYKDLDGVYSQIAADPLFHDVPSALPYCLSDKRPSQGHYFAFFPEKIGDGTQSIVFLHGFGGNFLFYIYLLKEEFPKSVILVPSWGAGWSDGTMQYLDDMYKDVKLKHSFLVRQPCLMAISAGGPAGFRLYNRQPDRFSCLVSLASAPSAMTVPSLKEDLKILMVNGRQDTRFKIARVQETADEIAVRVPHFEMHVVEGDHFFLLSKRDETFRAIKAFLQKETVEESGGQTATK
jgi:pimeloyl-ACP methyl ester carboxylesterase